MSAEDAGRERLDAAFVRLIAKAGALHIMGEKSGHVSLTTMAESMVADLNDLRAALRETRGGCERELVNVLEQLEARAKSEGGAYEEGATDVISAVRDIYPAPSAPGGVEPSEERIRQSEADYEAGRFRPAREALAEMRAKHFPPVEDALERLERAACGTAMSREQIALDAATIRRALRAPDATHLLMLDGGEGGRFYHEAREILRAPAQPVDGGALERLEREVRAALAHFTGKRAKMDTAYCEGAADAYDAVLARVEAERLRALRSPAPAPDALDLTEIRRRVEGATPGPWQKCGEHRGGCICRQVWSTRADCLVAVGIAAEDEDYTCGDGLTIEAAQANADFIAHAREDIPLLLAEIDRLSRSPSGTAAPVAELRAAFEHLRRVQARGHSQFITENGRHGGSPWAELLNAIGFLLASLDGDAAQREVHGS